MDEEACCALSSEPEEDEIVFHYRGFSNALGAARAYKDGTIEIHPQQAADFFQPGDKVAIVSNGNAEPYLTEFRQPGMNARMVINETDVQDFLFSAKSAAAYWYGSLNLLQGRVFSG
jgi:hypothetical protein